MRKPVNPYPESTPQYTLYECLTSYKDGIEQTIGSIRFADECIQRSTISREAYAKALHALGIDTTATENPCAAATSEWILFSQYQAQALLIDVNSRDKEKLTETLNKQRERIATYEAALKILDAEGRR